MQKNPFPILVTRSYLPEKQEFDKMIEQIWETHWLTNNGPLHQQLEKELCEYLKSDEVSLLVNGHLALETAITCLDLQGEIITTPFTFISTTNAILRSGCTPIFCDVKESDLTIDETKIEALITERTTAILPVHVYGHPCNVEAIEAIARKHGLKVIYDAAHAFGVRVNGKGISDYGDISMFSFHATKLFNTIEGGALAYTNRAYRDKISHIKNFGITDEEHAVYIGGNAKMNEFQAAMGLVNLKHMDKIIGERKQIFTRYRKNLDDIEGISYFAVDESDAVEYNYAYFPVLVEDSFGMSRDDLANALKEYNIFPRKYFYPLTCDFEGLAAYKDCDVPVAREASMRVLTIPIYNGLSMDTVDYITDCIKEIKARGKETPKA